MKSFKKIILISLGFFMIVGISFAEDDIVLDFDGTKVLCTLTKNDKFATLKSYDTVSEGEELDIKAQNIPYNKAVSEWIIGNKKIKANGNSYTYYVSKKDLNASKKLKISYKTRKAKKFKIIFDDRKLKGKNNSKAYTESLKNKTEIYERNSLSFSPKNISPNNTLTCMISKKTYDKIKNIKTHMKHKLDKMDDKFLYTVRTEDANSNNEIKLICTERKKEKIKISFDESKIKCMSKETNKAIKSGSKVLEGVELSFTSISNKAVLWAYGNISYIRPSRKKLSFKIHKSRLPHDAEEIVIKYKQ